MTSIKLNAYISRQRTKSHTSLSIRLQIEFSAIHTYSSAEPRTDTDAFLTAAVYIYRAILIEHQFTVTRMMIVSDAIMLGSV